MKVYSVFLLACFIFEFLAVLFEDFSQRFSSWLWLAELYYLVWIFCAFNNYSIFLSHPDPTDAVLFQFFICMKKEDRLLVSSGNWVMLCTVSGILVTFLFMLYFFQPSFFKFILPFLVEEYSISRPLTFLSLRIWYRVNLSFLKSVLLCFGFVFMFVLDLEGCLSCWFGRFVWGWVTFPAVFSRWARFGSCWLRCLTVRLVLKVFWSNVLLLTPRQKLF